jgi:hypothetical protein
VTFTTQSAAKRFFIDKIVAQAENEGAPLSRTEREMLAFSESDPEFAGDPIALSSQLNQEETDDEYEAKVAGLVARAFRQDNASDSRLGQQWYEARSVLAKGDHYILIMIDRGLERPPEVLGDSGRTSIVGNPVRIIFGGLAILIAGATALIGLFAVVIEGPQWEQIPAFVMTMLLFAAGAYLIRNARRGETR